MSVLSISFILSMLFTLNALPPILSTIIIKWLIKSEESLDSSMDIIGAAIISGLFLVIALNIFSLVFIFYFLYTSRENFVWELVAFPFAYTTGLKFCYL